MLNSILGNLFSEKMANKPALIFENRISTYADLRIRTLKANAFFLKLHSTTLPLLLTPTPEAIALYVAACFQGKRIIPIGPTLLKHQFSKLAPLINQHGLIVEASTWKKVRTDFPLISPTVVDIECSKHFSDKSLMDGRLELVFHTSSSTTQETKAVLVDLGYWSLFQDWFSKSFSARSEDRFLLSAPLHFDMSLVDLFIPLSIGASIVLPQKGELFYPNSFLSLLKHTNISFVHSVPNLWQNLILQRDGRQTPGFSLRKILYAGEGLTPYYFTKLKTYFPETDIHNVYGQTETNSFLQHKIIGVNDLAYPNPLGTEATFCKIAVNSNSEMLVTGKNVALGYFESGKLSPLSTPHNTGDRIVVKKGILYFLGRQKSAGFEPAEILSKVNGIDGVIQSVLIDTPKGPALFYQSVGRSIDTEERIKKITSYDLPVISRSFFPLNYNGKIDRISLLTTI